MHRVNKMQCKRDPCVMAATSVCKHFRLKHKCYDCRPDLATGCKHGRRGCPKLRRCSQCKAEAVCETPSPNMRVPNVRVSTGQKVFPGGPMGPLRVSPELV